MISNSAQHQQHLAAGKRKRNLEMKMRDELIEVKKNDSSPCPLFFLRALFASSTLGQQLLAMPRRSTFRKPSQAEIDAYDMEAVQGIRNTN